MSRKKYYLFLLTILCLSTSVATAYAGETTAMELINIQGCKGCHKLDDAGGNLGPALDGVGNRLTKMQLRQKLLNPKKNKPTSLMPDYSHLTATELKLLTNYLTGLR